MNTTSRPSTLVIGDVHHRIDASRHLIAKYSARCQRTVFLGDYFDAFGDGPREMRASCQWLRRSLKVPTRTHLLGNHDLAYFLTQHPQAWCPGWTPKKQQVFDEEVAGIGIGSFRIATAHELASKLPLIEEAGLTESFCSRVRQLPRCRCPEHGVKTVRVPWAEKDSRFTLHFEALAVEMIGACRSLIQAADLLQLDWDGVQRIVDRAVARGLLRRSTEGVRYVGLDEKSFGRGQRYVSIATDIKGARVLEVVPGNDQAAGESLWRALPPEQRSKVEAAAMDMSAGFAAVTRAQAPQAAIVHDKFHVAKLLNDAVDQTRRAEHQQLHAEGDDTLKNTRYLWLHGQLPEAKQAGFAELLEINLKTARAWAYKEQFVEFWGQADAAQGFDFFTQWKRSVMRSRLTKVKTVAKTLHQHLTNLLTYFMHPITNAVSEGFNSRIQAIKADARDFRRFFNYRSRILFHCGKLNMLPVLPESASH